MRKIKLILSVVACFVITLCLTACGPTEEEHQHSFDEGICVSCGANTKANVQKIETNLTVLSEENTMSGFRPSNLPTALEVQYTFTATESVEAAVASKYRYWHADFVVSFDKAVSANSVGLAGQYESWSTSWLAFENSGNYAVDFEAGQEIRLLLDAAGISINYEELCSLVKVFQCGAYDVNNALAGTTMTVQLRIYETEYNSEINSYNVETGKYYVLGEYTYTFAE